MSDAPAALSESRITSLPLVHQGKVRDVYAWDDSHLLIVTTDRLSAFDVILPQPIPGKGAVLTRMSTFWMQRFGDVVPNHLTDIDPAEKLRAEEAARVAGRAQVVRRLHALPIEAVVRGFLAGSGWKEYQRAGTVCGVALPASLRQAEKLAEPIFTPATKAEQGAHDENISFAAAAERVGGDVAERVRELSIWLYKQAAGYALERGIIIADTKFEFGLDDSGRIVLIDEVLTPDSSRFWPQADYRVGGSPPSFDKQYVRDYLENIDWDQTPPGPDLPDEVVRNTAARYAEAERRLMATPRA
ncbi:phosphoribosylaminoimidazolesuccinocarboxamide synthase [Algiphilus sp.]|uniref:phosphoribosylaminoimidazolesuccinocarboxamide synthase n=1 Tax=Algiphilus sp. TaxID=1872431 RepID=UPI001CA73C1E|nr:phosphoribosylaminoimidazolesuccinocarboxamide synthase [Algiphilus sp.]MBY8966299.1 phosphoribosylaminoimidazolesuccinocarboxamide synthase [Algiphilus acroporae]MCI5061514.1 phosphoribosylaminoimidazolesuccinocarboxamide synthase [Algiphilus sp.]MCI5102240.1 phosphoribosylaminoimidazolesuccinocarboxamide synthase [Algiphilus sp.]MCR9090392.1 phosphoribosylaminoimidazolesuccinocarboxamide synthase [Pseudomonadota bacterium]